MKKVVRKRRRKNQGVITVFVTLIMVPVVAITGVMVDIARLKMYSSQAAMAADAYGDAVLSEFDNLLKQLYGLFAVTQNEEGLEAIEKLAEYASYSFNPDADELGLTGFMPYKDVDMKLEEYENMKIEGASLSNPNVLMTQIDDFMRFRIVEEVIDESGILNCLEQFDSLSADMEVMKERKEISDSSGKALEAIDEYYEILKKLADYPAFKAEREKSLTDYSEKLEDMVRNDEEYETYSFYIQNQELIESAIEDYLEAQAAEDDSDEDDSDEDDSDDDFEYEEYLDYDPEEHKENLEKKLSSYAKAARDYTTGQKINFNNTDDIIDGLGGKVSEVEKVLHEIDQQIEQLRAELVGCSKEVADGINEEIKELEGLLKVADDFRATYELVTVDHNNKEMNIDNQKVMKEEADKLDEIKGKVLEGEEYEAGTDLNLKTESLEWYDFKKDKSEFYNELKKLCDPDKDGSEDKSEKDKRLDASKEAQENAEKELNKDEDTKARDISSTLASQLKSKDPAAGTVPSLTDYFAGGLSFKAVSQAGTSVLGKFLLASYDFGMFSSRVTGIEPKKTSILKNDGAEKKEDKDSEDSSEEKYVDYSLTKIEMSPKVNYLYGAELEYLFGGHNKSKENLNETRNIICGVRLTMNFGSTYAIKELNEIINAIAAAAAAASTVAAPLVKIAVSGALRMAVASMETAADWKALMDRKDVMFFKMRIGDLQLKDELESFLGETFEDTSESPVKITVTYEQYLYVLMCLMRDSNTLLSRTSDLITLNVNQAVNDGDELTELDFKMSETVTAVKSTCKVKADFLVLPDNFAQMYFTGTGIDAAIEALEDNYFGYSVIRGY